MLLYICSLEEERFEHHGVGYDAANDESADKQGHIAYYWKRRNEPIFPGSPHTVLKFCSHVFHGKVHFRLGARSMFDNPQHLLFHYS